MPLSEHEQRLLDDIEKALYAEDPKFASSVRAAKARRPGRRWIATSIVGVVVGLALVLLGLAVQVIFGVVGFVLIVAAVAYAAMMMKGGPGTPTDVSSLSGGSGRAGAKSKANTGLRARMEDRMRRRFDDNGS